MIDEVQKRILLRTAFPCNDQALSLLDKYNHIIAMEDELELTTNQKNSLALYKDLIFDNLRLYHEKAQLEIQAYEEKEDDSDDFSLVDRAFFLLFLFLFACGLLEVFSFFFGLMVAVSEY